MRVAFVNQPWNEADPPVESGSVAIWVYQVARHLAQSCHVTVYARRSRAGKRTECRDGIGYRYVSTSLDRRVLRMLHLASGLYGPARPYFAGWLYYLGYIVKVALDLRRARCDIVHIQNLSQFIPIIRALNPTIGIVLHMHCEWLTQLDPGVIRRRLKKADRVIGCSEYITQRIRRRFPEVADRCRTIYNGVDVNRPVAKDGRKDGALRHILFVGRISPEKGLHVLLEAFRRIAAKYPDVQLDIVGPESAAPVEFIFKLSDDPRVSGLISFCGRDYMSYLKERLAPHLIRHVRFSGSVPYSALTDRYAAADVYVQPSFIEAFPLPIPEAMAAGVPVVATRVGGVSEAVEDGVTGRLVEAGDVESLAEAILGLLFDDDVRKSMGTSARARAVELFSWEKIARNLLDLYSRMSDMHGRVLSESPGASVLSEDLQPSGCQVQ